MKFLFDITLQAPRFLCINDNQHYEATIAFMDNICQKVERDYIVTINFDSCLMLTPAAALLLFSTINSIQLSYGFERVKCSALLRTSSMLHDPLISSAGLWDALTCKDKSDVEKLIEMNNRFKTSNDPAIMKNVSQILTKVKGLTPEHIFFLTMAMKEAITNVVYHAYNPDSLLDNRWWQCAWVNLRNKQANIIIHDRGIGIIERYRKSDFTDEELLKEAMLQGFSSSGIKNRGMGSEDMKRPVDELNGEQSLTLYTGEYIYDYSLKSIEPKITKRNSSICGTLIHWQCGYGANEND
jgi:anti-sigma regulatory factor (Ser/Thr protein kinase)